MPFNPEKLKALQAQAAANKLGGKGSVRRTKQVVHRNVVDDKKVLAAMQKLGARELPGVESVEFVCEDHVLSFKAPKVQAAMQANTFAISGFAVKKSLGDMLPQLNSQLGPDALQKLQAMLGASGQNIDMAALQQMLAGMGGAGALGGAGADADFEAVSEEAPELVE